MIGGLTSDPAKCTAYGTDYGTGGFSGCLVNTTVELGPYRIDNIAMASATEMKTPQLASRGESFR